MKKLLYLLASFYFSLNLMALEDINSYISENHRIEFLDSEFDSKQAFVLAIPGFNIKPESFKFVLDEFAKVGIPAFSFSFSGTKNGEDKSLMNFENWEANTKAAIYKTLELAQAYNRKLIIIGHSMGGLYALHTLNAMHNAANPLDYLKNVKLALLAPADGLKSLKTVILNKAPLISLFASNLPENNLELIDKISTIAQMIENFELGTMICGEHAAQARLSLNAFRGLVTPAQNLKNYPKTCSKVFFYEDDGLMDPQHYQKYPQIFPSCSVHNLGLAGNEVLAHTFEHLKNNQADLYEKLINPVLEMLKETQPQQTQQKTEQTEIESIEKLTDLDLD